MKKILLATTALFALSGISVAAADVSISGHVRYHYDSWSDEVEDADMSDYAVNKKTGAIEANVAGSASNNNNSMDTDVEIWIKGKMVSDNGLTIAPEARIKGKDGKIARHYIKLSDDWGTLTLGRQHSVGRTMSLDGEWRGTVSGANAPVGATISGVMKTPDIGAYAGPAAVIYQTPNISGFQAGVHFGDPGGTSKANATDIALVYSLDAFGDGGLKVGYISSSTSAKNDASKKNDNNQLGVELTSGDFLASIVQTKKKATPKSGGASDKQNGQELELAYTASDSLTINAVLFSSKNDEGAGDGDKYKSTGIGAKYTIAPGLYASLGYTTFTHTPATAGTKKNKGNGMRLRVHAGF